MKKTIVWILVLALLAVASVLGTIAYLMDEATADNVMTVGKVGIELLEYERIDTETKNAEAKVQEFTPNKPLLPAVTENGFDYTPGETYVNWEQNDDEGNVIKPNYTSPIWDPANINNEVDKMVFVRNTGDYSAYVRVFFAFEAGKYTTKTLFDDMIHINLNDNDSEWKWEWIPFLATDKDGHNYFIAVATYQKVLESKAVTEISLSQIALDSSARNDEVAEFDKTYNVLVHAQGIQSDGFGDVPEDALIEGFGRDIPFDMTLAQGVDLYTALHYYGGNKKDKITGKVTSVTFGLNSKHEEVVSNTNNRAVFTSVEQDAEVYTYYVPNAANPNKYDLYVLADDTIYTPKISEGLFKDMASLTTVDTTNMDVSRTENMKAMFRGCKALTSLEVSKWDVSKVKLMNTTFTNCENLKELNVSGWNVGNVTTMSSMFYNCSSLESLNVTNWDVKNVTDMTMLFYNCQKLNDLNVSNWKVDKVTTMQHMFYWCKALESLTLNSWNVSNVTTFKRMFSACNGLTSLNISGWNTASATDMSYMFFECKNLETIDVRGFDLDGVTTIKGMFELCLKVKDLAVDGWNVSSVTDMSGVFRKCNAVVTLDVSNWITDNVTTMASLFSNCSSLATIDVSGWNTDKVTDMSFMFNDCNAVTELNVSGFKTAGVTDMASMFNNCFLVPELAVSGWNTDNVTDMSYMFNNCKAVTELKVSGFNTAGVTNMASMFNNCFLVPELAVSGWNTDKVTNMEYMFNGCSSLTELNVSAWNTTNVISMEFMFNDCDGLTKLDLSSWNTEAVKDSEQMFAGCSNLVTISVGDGWDMSQVEEVAEVKNSDGTIKQEKLSSDNMFLDCVKLEGGNGTKLIKDGDGNAIVNKTYARVDTAENPGYLTYKAAPTTNP